MAKAKANEKPSESSLERTVRLAQKLVAVPKAEADKQQQKWEKAQRNRQTN